VITRVFEIRASMKNFFFLFFLFVNNRLLLHNIRYQLVQNVLNRSVL
jgi:hypothetical protein